MLVYHNTKANFDHDVINNMIADYVKEALIKHGINDQNSSEYNAWNNSMQFMHNVLDDPRIPLNCDIDIEYNIPQTSKRVDFIISGSDDYGKDNVIIIELKQWSTVEKVDDLQTHSVRAFTGGAVRVEAHPCYQAYSYAVHIMNYSEVVADKNIHLYPCSYCHNYREADRYIIEDPIYKTWIEEAPLFLKTDMMKLRDFILKFITKKSSDGELLYKIDNGKIRPAKALQDCLASMLKGNKEFQLMDEQSTVYDACIKAMADCNKDGHKRVMIIQGGPGTGKSVLAINLLCDLLRTGSNVAYVTKNSAPRKCYLNLLSKNDVKKQVNINSLFRSPFGLCEVPENSYDCLLIDEAHRLVKKYGRDYHGQNQIKECMNAGTLSVFFIDEDQRITVNDIGSVDGIIAWARELGIDDNHIFHGDDLVLSSQFRCNGSDGYIAFIDDLLGIKQTANKCLDLEGFKMKVFDDPNQMRDELRQLNQINNKARMVAGYCFDWDVKFHRGDYDIYLDNGFKARWNLDENSELWAILPSSFEEVGCIHTCQGLEFDYVGVIIGDDLIYRDGKVVTNKDAISKDDNSSKIRTCKDDALADRLIRDTYKVLMTRGQKGCFIYCKDQALREYIKGRLK